MNAATSPFDRAPVVMEKVSRKELIGMLQARINKHYMPSATGSVKFNRKPEYIRNWMTMMPSLWPSVCLTDPTEFRAFDQFGDFVGMDTRPPNAIYLFINLAPIFIYVRLDTDQMLVANHQAGELLAFLPWDRDEQAVAIDRIQLQETLDTYV
jgi:hypothetical protein